MLRSNTRVVYFEYLNSPAALVINDAFQPPPQDVLDGFAVLLPDLVCDVEVSRRQLQVDPRTWDSAGVEWRTAGTLLSHDAPRPQQGHVYSLPSSGTNVVILILGVPSSNSLCSEYLNFPHKHKASGDT
jgi:hypothetical protein